MKGPLTKKRIRLFTATVFACVITAGCTQQGEVIEVKESEVPATTETVNVSNEEMNIQIVEAVLQQELNGPDKEYVQLVNAAMGGTEDPDSVKQKENEMKLTSYIKEKYLPYFTEDGVMVAESIGMLFQYQNFYTFDKEYQIRLVDSEVKQSDIDTASNQYHIKATVEFTAPGEEPSQHEIEGKAIFSTKDGKIGGFVLGQKDPTLSKKIFELGEEE
ncbi:hypothetical protein [Sporosarcina sp. D27]|uniref:hypothetical protein n=1 Tax=Sporosarcina sp. D27 TaxID=1382305 RepID=UPI00046F1A41|nr:hypothetical protein [Sporosarcina sp. D27]